MNENILIVDDVSSNRKLIMGILKNSLNNVNYFEADSGIEALRIIEEVPISVMILDIMMPEVDGLEVLGRIKNNHIHKEIQVIMCSALSDKASLKLALQKGALDYFTKPLIEEHVTISLPLKVRNAIAFYEQKRKLLEYYKQIKTDLKLAEVVQKSLISKNKKYTYSEMFGKYSPYVEIGGDMFVYIREGDREWFIMADVSGHGISSAMISVIVNLAFSLSIKSATKPSEVLEYINKTLYFMLGCNIDISVAAFIGFVKRGMLSYSNAGLPYPILIMNSKNTVRNIDANGFLLGVINDAHYENYEIKLEDEDMLICYTDGLFDKGETNGYLNWESVRKYCENLETKRIDKNSDFIDEMVTYFQNKDGIEFIDDVAVMCIKIIS